MTMIGGERARRAEEFARAVMADDGLREGFECMMEALEWMAFVRWKQTPSGEGWRAIAGELAAYRQLCVQLRELAKENGDGGK